VKAVLVDESVSAPERRVRYADAPDPELAPRRVLIRVDAVSVNRTDLTYQAGRYGRARALVIPGEDVAGVVEAIGPEVDNVRPGDRVMALLPGGGYAQYVAAHMLSVFPMPKNLTPEEACTIPVVFLTSWFALMKRAGLQAGETALIQAAGSGCGMAGIAIAKWAGATVITTAGSDEKVARGKQIGADHGINYSTHDFADEVMRITGGAGVDVCLESVGGEVYRKSVQVLKDSGRLVSVGRASEQGEGGGPRGEADPAEIARRGLRVESFSLPSTVPTGEARAEIAVITDLLERGALRTVTDRVFPMSQVHDALAYLDNRQNFGKVVMKAWE